MRERSINYVLIFNVPLLVLEWIVTVKTFTGMSDETLFFEIGDARRWVVKGIGVLAGVITVKWEIHTGLQTIYQDLY